MVPDDLTPRLYGAVFLDRDGVLIADVHHLVRADQMRILPGVPEALARLRAAGWRLIVATNQSVVARGMITEADLRGVHRALLAEIRSRGGDLDAIYYCPHHPEGTVPEYRRACNCRKPNPGMLLRAATDRRLDLRASVMIGDAPSDVEAGCRAGCRTVLIRREAAGTGPGPECGPPAGDPAPDYFAGNLQDAADWILAEREAGR